jgi:hypothetical protein
MYTQTHRKASECADLQVVFAERGSNVHQKDSYLDVLTPFVSITKPPSSSTVATSSSAVLDAGDQLQDYLV